MKPRDWNLWKPCLIPVSKISLCPDYLLNCAFLSGPGQSPLYSSSTISTISPTKIYSPTLTYGPLSPLTMVEDDEYSQDNDNNRQFQEISHQDIIIINTHYDPTLATNRRVPDELRGKQERFNFTEAERLRAKNAIVPDNLNDLEEKVPL